MNKFEILSIAEDGYQSDRLTIQQRSYIPNNKVLKISITSKRNLVVESCVPSMPGTTGTITAFDIDIDGLLQFVQDAKIFINEEEMIAKLKGK